METYLFIGLFVGAINTLWKFYLQSIDKVGMPPSVVTFIVTSVLWPVTIPLMIWKAVKLGKNSNS